MDPILGTIILFAGNFAPQGWAFCDGAILPINNNQAVFTILGTTYGGNGATDFGLPNLNKGLAADQPKYIIALQGVYPSRN